LIPDDSGGLVGDYPASVVGEFGHVAITGSAVGMVYEPSVTTDGHEAADRKKIVVVEMAANVVEEGGAEAGGPGDEEGGRGGGIGKAPAGCNTDGGVGEGGKEGREGCGLDVAVGVDEDEDGACRRVDSAAPGGEGTLATGLPEEGGAVCARDRCSGVCAGVVDDDDACSRLAGLGKGAADAGEAGGESLFLVASWDDDGDSGRGGGDRDRGSRGYGSSRRPRPQSAAETDGENEEGRECGGQHVEGELAGCAVEGKG
jgi:hypothetical protein